MTLYAIFSDVHGNTRSLERTLRFLQACHVDAYIQLGDLGVAPLLRLDDLPIYNVFGNWEVSGLPRFPPERQETVAAWPAAFTRENWIATHATPAFPVECATLAATRHYMQHHRPRWTQLFPSLLHDEDAIWTALASLATQGRILAFHGHTHVQAVQQLSHDNHLRRLNGSVIDIAPDALTLVGVGSIGVPRDGHHSRCVLFDDVAAQVELISIPSP